MYIYFAYETQEDIIEEKKTKTQNTYKLDPYTF